MANLLVGRAFSTAVAICLAQGVPGNARLAADLGHGELARATHIGWMASFCP
jgi:hypothetical protein